jgi:hypothetical protein
MFIWLGINIEDQLPELKRRKAEIEGMLGITDTVVNLPLHVSLRISSQVPEEISHSLISAILEFYEKLSPVELFTDGIEREGNIIWLRFKANDEINSVHHRLCALMNEQFAIPLHSFDLEFKYHTTLFLGISEDELSAAYDMVRFTDIPKYVILNHPVIGVSESGLAGTYRIIHTVEV